MPENFTMQEFKDTNHVMESTYDSQKDRKKRKKKRRKRNREEAEDNSSSRLSSYAIEILRLDPQVEGEFLLTYLSDPELLLTVPDLPTFHKFNANDIVHRAFQEVSDYLGGRRCYSCKKWKPIDGNFEGDKGRCIICWDNYRRLRERRLRERRQATYDEAAREWFTAREHEGHFGQGHVVLLD